MKNKFKVGDKITAKKDLFIHSEKNITKGKQYIITTVGVSDITIKNDLNQSHSFDTVVGRDYYGNWFRVVELPKTLTIKKLTRTRNGEEYFTWQFSVNGKVSNHNFNSPQFRDKSLKNFIKYIQENDFKIVKG